MSVAILQKSAIGLADSLVARSLSLSSPSLFAKVNSFSSFSEVYSYPRANFETTYVTFDRNTGKRFTRQMVNKDESLELLVMNALLEQYFSEWDSEVLADILVFDPDDLEEAGFWLPEFTDPYLLNDNLCFYYWEHDIANRVAGQPYCALPYDVIEPYLTEEGKQYFKH